MFFYLGSLICFESFCQGRSACVSAADQLLKRLRLGYGCHGLPKTLKLVMWHPHSAVTDCNLTPILGVNQFKQVPELFHSDWHAVG